MSQILSLLERLQQEKVHITLSEDRLKITAPKGTVSGLLLQELQQHKPQILDYLRGLQQVEPSLIRPLPEQALYHASHAQLRLWTLSQLGDASVAYNVFSAHRLSGSLVEEALEKAFNALIARHEILRTTFVSTEDGLKQQVSPPGTGGLRLEKTELSGQPDREAALKALIGAESARSFDLEKGPLVHAGLVVMGPGAHVLLLNMHHLVSDGWSLGIFVEELIYLYGRYSQGLEAVLEPLPIQYKDFAAWQNEYLNGPGGEQDRNAWLRHFADGIPALQLPTCKKRPDRKTFNGARKRFEFEAVLVPELLALGQQHQCSLYITLVSVLNLVFHRYTGQSEIIIGATTTGRTHGQLKRQIGFFVNTLPLKTTVAETDTFRDLLVRTKEVILAAFEHQAYPFDRLIDDLKIKRDLSRSAVFDVLVEIHNYDNLLTTPEGVRQLDAAVSVTPIEVERGTSIFDLNLEFKESDGKLLLEVEYNTDLYEEFQVERLAKHFAKMARQACVRPGAPLHAYELILDEELAQLNAFNRTQKTFPLDTTLATALDAPARTTGPHPAVIDRCGSLSYKELVDKANRLAHFLRARNVTRETVVAVLMDRSCAFAWAMLGIWKAGGVYLPLDPGLPAERAGYMLKDAGVPVMLTSGTYIREALSLQWQNNTLHTIMCLDSYDVYAEQESLNESMKEELWAYVGQQAADDITGGGWIDSYTGRPLSRAEMEEYSENVFRKLRPYLHAQAKVLEIGCASGITMFRLAPYAGQYLGVDLSAVILEKNAEVIREKGFTNITQAKLYAHEVDRLPQAGFDVVIINSVVQNFNGYNYLRDVISKCLSLLTPDGILFIGDVMDLEARHDLILSLRAFQQSANGKSFRTKLDWHDELFVSQSFFDDLACDFPEIGSVTHSRKIHTIENELTRFRFDTLIQLDKNRVPGTRPRPTRHKYQYDLRVLEKQPAGPPAVTVQPCDLAYIIYTSGSTGLPKGAMIEHLGMMNHLYAKINDLGLHAGSIVAQTASQSFDISIWQFFAALLAGGTTVIYDNEALLDLDAFCARLHADRVTVLEVVPSYLEVLLTTLEESKTRHQLPSLRYLLVTGETVKPALVSRWYQWFGHSKVVNAYGPTEASDDITHFEVDPSAHYDQVPVGAPIQNLQIYIVDKYLNLCPIGVKGEVCVSGVGVGRGYLNEVEKTTQAFVENPFAAVPGTRMYRTGDWGRYTPQGLVELFGRMDYQVKIRGHRLELGEVESELLRLPAVKDAAVVVRENAGKQKELHGYLVLRDDYAFDELALGLRRRLPDYMIPAGLTILPVMPLTSNGKVDRGALPDPGGDPIRQGYAAPVTQTEVRLMGLWEKLLESTGLGIDANFFENGGHSLKATRLVSKVNSLWASAITLKDVFENPTIRTLARCIDKKDQAKLPAILSLPPLPYYDVSSGQQRLWVLSQMEEGSRAYNEVIAYEWAGPLDWSAFERTVGMLLARHESLRTTFHLVEGKVKQKIRAATEISLPVTRTELGPQADPARAAEQLIRQELLRAFDLERGPLFRVNLIAAGPEHFFLVFNIHHIVSDGWSEAVLLKDFSAIYNALAGGRPSPLAALRTQYKEYAAWLQNYLESPAAAVHEAFWRTTLAGDLPVLDLLTHQGRPPVQTSSGDSLDFTFDHALYQGLGLASKAHQTTMFTLLVGLLNVLFYKYTGSRDVLLGTSTANRDHEELEDQVGFYLNTIPIRNRLDPQQTFSESLPAVKSAVQAALDARLYPFDRIIGGLRLPNDPSRSAVFDVLVEFQSFTEILTARERHYQSVDGARIRPCPIRPAYSKLDLNFSFYEEEALKIHLTYNPDLYTRAQMQQLLERLNDLGLQIIGEPRLSIARLSILREADRGLLDRFNATQVPPTPYPTFVTHFEAHLPAMRDKTAVVHRDAGLTYGELNRRANQLANHLLGLGVRSGEPVVWIGERSLDFAVAVLGILKSGGAYVPMDPELPADRIRTIVADCNARIIMASGAVLLRVRKALSHDLPGLHFVSLQPEPGKGTKVWDREDVAGNSTGNPVVRSGDRELAYLMFTSGSTGAPKGVMIEHGGMLNHLYAKIRSLALAADSVVAQNASHTFDISIWQLLAPLLSGGQSVIYDHEAVLQFPPFLNSLAAARVSVLEVVPTYLNLLLTFLAANPAYQPALGSLQYLLVTGETLYPALVERWFGLFPGIRMVNAYGPTEASDDVTHYVMDRAPAGHAVPIGKAVQNTRLFILDNDLNVCPAGVKGEIFVTGAGVGRGYLNQVEKTHEAFIVHDTLGRGYLTGDLGVYLDNGNLAFYGRKDQQVKLHGQRIEPGEIEKCLLETAGVQKAAVTVAESPNGEKYLCAFVTTLTDDSTESTVKSALASRLPAFMVPARVVVLGQMPLTPNGKVDRKALVSPGLPLTGSAYLAPRNEAERKMVAVWEKVLDRSRVSIDDNYFAIGGDSIKAIRILSELYQEGLQLSVREIFQHQTIRKIARHLTLAGETAGHLPVTGRVYPTPAQYELLGYSAAARHPVYVRLAFQARRRLGRESVTQVLQQLLAHHDALRITFAEKDGVVEAFNQGPSVQVPLDEDDLPDASGGPELLFGAVAGWAEGTPSAAGPMVRVGLFHLPQGDVLVLLVHPLLIDGESACILQEDALTLLNASLVGAPAGLPARTASFKQWSEKLHAYAGSDALKGEVPYWTAVAGRGVPLPTPDGGPGGDPEPGEQRVEFALSREETRLLLEEANQPFSTETNEILLTALALGHCQYAGHDRLLLHWEGPGRAAWGEGIDVSRTVGQFTVKYPVVLDAAFRGDLSRQIKEVKETLRQVPKRGLGYGLLQSQGWGDMPVCASAPPRVRFTCLPALTAGGGQSAAPAIQVLALPASLPAGYTPGDYDLDLYPAIHDDQLLLTVMYQAGKYRRESAAQLADCIRRALHDLIVYCTSRKDKELTPSDLSFKKVSTAELDYLHKLFN